MKTIHVTASREYDVVIGAGLLDECGQRIAAAVPGAEKAVVYTDTTVFPLYAKRVADSLKAAGFTVLQTTFLPENTPKRSATGSVSSVSLPKTA